VYNKRIRIAEHPLEIHLLFAVWTSLLLSHYTPTMNAELVESALSFVKKNHKFKRTMVKIKLNKFNREVT